MSLARHNIVFISLTAKEVHTCNSFRPLSVRSARDVGGAHLPGPGATAPQTEQPIPTATTLTVSGRFQKPEIVLFAEPTQKHSRVLVLKVSVKY